MNLNWIYIHFTCIGFEPASGGVSDSGSDSSEGDAGLCRLLHPARKAVRCGRGAQNPTGGLKSTRSNVQHGSKSISHYFPLSGYQQTRTRLFGVICSKGENH